MFRTGHLRTAGPAARLSFTLIELVVTVAIIVLLAGLLVSAGSAVLQQAERRRTEAALELLSAAVREWETSADRKLTWWEWYYDGGSLPPGAYDIAHGDLEQLILSEILRVVLRAEPARAIFARIEPELAVALDGANLPAWIDEPAEISLVQSWGDALTVLDAWGTPIYATHPGRPWAPEDGDNPPRNDDGTIRTWNELRYGACRNREVVFVSAGPDRRFGLPEEFPPEAPPEAVLGARRDNLYSGALDFGPGY